MTKSNSVYVCQQCGNEFPKWNGKCPSCGEWGSLVESLAPTRRSGRSVIGGGSKNTRSIELVTLDSVASNKLARVSTKISELDRVLGGGIVPGQVVLIAGEPGIGKSTILLQLAQNLNNVIYVSGEESVAQIKIRADRLRIKSKSIKLVESTDIDQVIEVAQVSRVSKASIVSEKNPRYAHDTLGSVSTLIVDSIQTMQTSELSGMSGSVGQVRECTSRLVKLAKSTGIPIFIVGHVTKSGSVAGPSVLMHIVDTVLWFEGSNDFQYRLLRARKNRFGPTDEVGIFSMEEKGLMSVSDTTGIFLSETSRGISGSVIGVIMEGTRPIMVEIQSLIVPTKMAFPRRIAQGIDSKKIELLIAVLQRRAGIDLSGHDVFVNVLGGIKVKDTGIDLPIVMSLASVYFDKPLTAGSVAVGEVGLMGELREVTAQSKRLAEARRLGYRNTISNKTERYLVQLVKKYFKQQ